MLRRVVRAVYLGLDPGDLSALDNQTALAALEAVLVLPGVKQPLFALSQNTLAPLVRSAAGGRRRRCIAFPFPRCPLRR